MAKKDYAKQYCFRLNLDNPDHLRVYRVLEDLNLNIHRSISNFVVKALLSYIKGNDASMMTNKGKDEADKNNGYVSKKELDGIKKQIRDEVLGDVINIISNTALVNQSAMNQVYMQQLMTLKTDHQDIGKVSKSSSSEESKPDDTLEEMSLLFANGNFGEE